MIIYKNEGKNNPPFSIEQNYDLDKTFLQGLGHFLANKKTNFCLGPEGLSHLFPPYFRGLTWTVFSNLDFFS